MYEEDIEMAASVMAVENLLGYRFKQKKLVEEALTHPSCCDSFSYQRLEFVGDAALGLAVTNHVFLKYPHLDPGKLSLLRSANISTEKLARVAVRHRLYRYLRHNVPGLDEKIFRHLLEPIVTLDVLMLQQQPVTVLFESCQKDGKQVDISYRRAKDEIIASVTVDGKFITSASSEHKENAKLHAAKAAIQKLSYGSCDPLAVGIFNQFNQDGSIEGAKQKLHELCDKKKWPKPNYIIEREDGPAHQKEYTSSVEIEISGCVVFVIGKEKPRMKEAESSAASEMLLALKNSNYF